MIRHRVRQFLAAGRQPSRDDFELAACWLDGRLLELFEAQHPRDIVHSAGTARWLLERGHDDADLIGAALLHDVAKGRQRRIDRTFYVLAGAAGQAERLGKSDSRLEIRRAVARSVTHSKRGASLLREAGASPRLVDLTARHHESPGDDPVLALLQEADAEN